MSHIDQDAPRQNTPVRYGIRAQTGLKAGDWQMTLADGGAMAMDTAQNAGYMAGDLLQKAGGAVSGAFPTWAN